MKKILVIAAIVLLTIGKLEAFILFTSGGNSANADHANSIDNGFGTNTFLQGFLYQFDNTTVDVSGSAGGSYDGRYYLGPSVDATFQVGIQVHGSLAYFNGGYRGSLFKALVYGYSPAQGAWAGATNAWFFVNTGFNNLDGYSTETAIPLSNFQNVLGHFVGSPTANFASPPVLDAGGHMFSLTLDDGRYLQNIQGSNVDTSTMNFPNTTSNTISGLINYGQIDGVPTVVIPPQITNYAFLGRTRFNSPAYGLPLPSSQTLTNFAFSHVTGAFLTGLSAGTITNMFTGWVEVYVSAGCLNGALPLTFDVFSNGIATGLGSAGYVGSVGLDGKAGGFAGVLFLGTTNIALSARFSTGGGNGGVNTTNYSFSVKQIP